MGRRALLRPDDMSRIYKIITIFNFDIFMEFWYNNLQSLNEGVSYLNVFPVGEPSRSQWFSGP